MVLSGFEQDKCNGIWTDLYTIAPYSILVASQH